MSALNPADRMRIQFDGFINMKNILGHSVNIVELSIHQKVTGFVSRFLPPAFMAYFLHSSYQ